ncbi:MAG: alpha/beta hydrolase family protein [Maricaulaceae bacterium]
MRLYRLRAFAALFGLVSWAAGCGAAEPEAFFGAWSGVLDAGAAQLPLVGHVKPGEDAPRASFDSPDQGAFDVPADTVEIDADAIAIAWTSPPARFEATLSADAQTLDGAWVQGGARLALRLTRSETAAAPERPRPQTPSPPFPYTAELVTVEAPDARLAGVLTTPDGAGPFPAALLISGSGPQDRDSTIFGHKPFWVIADHLARAGVAVLRLDDRGVGASTGDRSAADVWDFAADARAALDVLRAQDRIDPARTGFIGHSLGSTIAGIAAGDAAPPPDFIVSLNGAGVDLNQVLRDQLRAILEASGATQAVIAEQAREQAAFLDAVIAAPDAATAQARAREILEARTGLSEAAIAAQMSFASAGMRKLYRYDPLEGYRGYAGPVLAVFGERDTQVTPGLNAGPFRVALAESASDVARAVVVLDGLNHLLQPAETGAVAEYAQIETTIAPEALALITEWVLALQG